MITLPTFAGEVMMPHADREVRLAYCRARHAANRDAANATRKAAYHAADKAIEKAKRRAWYDANTEKAKAYERARQYKLSYGITVAEYDAMLAAQGGGCAICGAAQPSSKKHPGARYHHRYFAVDHCHKTGKVRGLLCVSCNVGLGRIEAWYMKHEAKILAYLGQ